MKNPYNLKVRFRNKIDEFFKEFRTYNIKWFDNVGSEAKESEELGKEHNFDGLKRYVISRIIRYCFEEMMEIDKEKPERTALAFDHIFFQIAARHHHPTFHETHIPHHLWKERQWNNAENAGVNWQLLSKERRKRVI